ncbi:hypothetical protein [Sphingobacterium composti Ten et al. 2007 non Yoo et al. 2007]|uniref:hypothetical protein n=1 Tax=Sphingobacterium composti TaxID=363260 RepID=UPI00135C4433|nr:hypothetical protein [Sphingobacterium composti Ten et al. 2007 non Yoo et al. 2007]
MKHIIKSLALAGVLMFSSCASIVSKSNWPISINSNPTDARIVITDDKGLEVYSGISPASLKLKSGNGFFKKATYQIKFEKDGFETKKITINSKLNGWYFGNLLIGGVIGMLIVDPATGAMYKIEDDLINENLVNKVSSGNNNAHRLMIKDINNLSEKDKENLVRVN